MWPQVRDAIPSATLDVYYGFWPYAMWNEQPHLVKLRKIIEPMLKQPGVHYHGMRSELELAAAYASAGFYAYPTDKAETSGIALMKAQACGCVPVTSGQTISALPETCGAFDLGSTGRPGYISQDSQWQHEYLTALITAARRPGPELSALRKKMKASARSRFNWATVAAQWTSLFAEVRTSFREAAILSSTPIEFQNVSETRTPRRKPSAVPLEVGLDSGAKRASRSEHVFEQDQRNADYVLRSREVDQWTRSLLGRLHTMAQERQALHGALDRIAIKLWYTVTGPDSPCNVNVNHDRCTRVSPDENLHADSPKILPDM